MRSQRIRVVGVATLAVLYAALLSACGVSRVVDPVAHAATRSDESGGAKVAMTIAVSGDAGAATTVTAVGEIGNDTAHLTMDLGGAGDSLGLSKIEELVVEQDGSPVIYLALGSLAQGLGSDKKWLKVDLSQAGTFGSTFSKLMASAQQNPMDSLTALEHSADFQEIGHTTIDGDVTTHYEGTVDLAKALKDKGIDPTKLMGASHANAPAAIPYEVYVGSDGKVRRVTSSYDTPVSAGKEAHAKVTIDYTDWGIDPLIGPPPADEVFDATRLLSKSLGG